MAYQLVRFDGVDLPVYNPEQDHDTMATPNALIDSLGGAFDFWGNDRRLGRRQQHNMTGEYWGETTYLVDESGNRVVDESGNYVIFGDGAQVLRSKVSALRAKQGARGNLVRKRLDDDEEQWKTARLLQIVAPQRMEHRTVRAELRCQFETTMAAWRAADSVSITESVSSGTTTSIVPANSGQVTVYDAVLTVSRTSGTITQVDIESFDGGIKWSWSGSLGSGDVLTVDAGSRTVKKNSADAYDGFALDSNHSSRGWLPLQTGMAPFYVTLTGGAGDVKIEHYDQYL